MSLSLRDKKEMEFLLETETESCLMQDLIFFRKDVHEVRDDNEMWVEIEEQDQKENCLFCDFPASVENKKEI